MCTCCLRRSQSIKYLVQHLTRHLTGTRCLCGQVGGALLLGWPEGLRRSRWDHKPRHVAVPQQDGDAHVHAHTHGDAPGKPLQPQGVNPLL